MGAVQHASSFDAAVATPGRRIRRDLASKAWRSLTGERRPLIALAALSVLAAQAESAALVLIALLADGVARGGTDARLELGPFDLSVSITAAGVATAAAILSASLIVLVTFRIWATTYARLERNSRDQIVTSFAHADWEHQSSQISSRVQSRVLRLMDARATAFDGLVGWIRSTATILVFIIVAAIMSPLIAATIVLFAALLSLAVFPIRRRIARLSGETAKQEVTLVADIAEAADHGADVQVYGAWPVFLSRFNEKSHRLQGLRSRMIRAKSLMTVVYQYGALALILSILLIIPITGAGGQFANLAAAALLLLRSVQYGQQLQRSLQIIAEAVPRIELLERELVIQPTRIRLGNRALGEIEHLELRNVEYQYPDSETPALSGITLELRPGRIIGVAGPSGSGKSTLAQILLRLRCPTSGDYLVNSVPAQQYSQASWNRHFSHVPQQPRLLHGSLSENVSFLDHSILPSDIVASLEAVGLSELAQHLPNGLDTPLGPTDRNLSGGQIQRLGIARALVRSPTLIVLDEPTSALDVNAERVVADSLSTLRGRSDVIVVVIAHRPSTLALCEEMIVLHEGRVVANGHVQDVIDDNEFLAATWRS